VLKNAWAAGAVPRTPLGELTTLPNLLARLRVLLLGGKVGDGRWRGGKRTWRGGKGARGGDARGGQGRGSGTATFWGESYLRKVA